MTIYRRATCTACGRIFSVPGENYANPTLRRSGGRCPECMARRVPQGHGYTKLDPEKKNREASMKSAAQCWQGWPWGRVSSASTQAAGCDDENAFRHHTEDADARE